MADDAVGSEFVDVDWPLALMPLASFLLIFVASIALNICNYYFMRADLARCTKTTRNTASLSATQRLKADALHQQHQQHQQVGTDSPHLAQAGTDIPQQHVQPAAPSAHLSEQSPGPAPLSGPSPAAPSGPVPSPRSQHTARAPARPQANGGPTQLNHSHDGTASGTGAPALPDKEYVPRQLSWNPDEQFAQAWSEVPADGGTGSAFARHTSARARDEFQLRINLNEVSSSRLCCIPLSGFSLFLILAPSKI